MFKKANNLKSNELQSELKFKEISSLSRIETALNDLQALNVEKQNTSISKTEYFLRKSKIIKKLYAPDL
ncbi:hypothetical protein [Hanstruepera marina]|uniref:hypothetical protein n=1 Tax=Hanstruepera marina TaxID=2873265 RepID=UPI001CA66D1D|nr:hypothetical protein [Hanstruepera marina]